LSLTVFSLSFVGIDDAETECGLDDYKGRDANLLIIVLTTYIIFALGNPRGFYYVT
jgi:hypothetical protein